MGKEYFLEEQLKDNFKTHKVFNQFSELRNYNLFLTDAVLTEYFEKNGLTKYQAQLSQFGEELGREDAYNDAHLANKYVPELKLFDTRGNRLDQISFHPAWHRFMAWCKTSGLIATAFKDDTSFRWSYMAANFILQNQVEAGAMCPATMTLASMPILQSEPQLWNELKEKLLSLEYDKRDLPISQKKSIWIGMGMTEKQGGSDVRMNTTVAVPVAESGRSKEYQLTGHKWFFSAPMCDAHLVVARTSDTDAISCFFVPRWKPDGAKNPIHIQQLKDKVGNRSNSSTEVEFKNAYGVMIGEEGRGIPTIIQMANNTRMCCVLGSTAIIRQAVVQSIAYTRQRVAFGKTLANQPLMKNVLVDFAVESEAAEVLSLKLAEVFEQGETNESAKAWKRILTPAAKYWICKRGEAITAEAMETFGGNGYIEDGVMGRLFREAPVNSIWEGSGNVMCLDVLRAISKKPEMLALIFEELKIISDGNAAITQELLELQHLLQSNPERLEAMSRLITEKFMLIIQACLMIERSPKFMSDAFIELRIKQKPAANFGAFLPFEGDYDQILERAFPSK